MDFYFGIDLLQQLRQYYEGRLSLALAKGFDQQDAKYHWLFKELECRVSTLRKLMSMISVLPEFMCRQTEEQIFAMVIGHTTTWFSNENLGGEQPRDAKGNCIYYQDTNPYLKVVVRYLSEEALRKYSFSTLVWYHLRSELSNYARDQVGKPQEIPIEFYCEIPAPEIAPIDDGLWRVIEDNLTYKQFEAIQFRNQGYTNREIAELCGVGRKAIEKRFARIRKILSDYKEN